MKLDMENRNQKSELDLTSPILAQKKPINRFIITSGLVHVITASAILITNHIPQNDPSKELVEVEFSAPADINAAPETAAVPEVAATTPEPQAMTESPAPTPAPVQKEVVVAPKPVVKQTPDTKQTPVVSTIATPDVEPDLSQAEQKQEQQAAAAQIDEDTQKAEQALAEASAAAAEQIQKENEAAAAQVAARAEVLREENAANEAAALAQAKAQADAAAEAEQVAAAELVAEKEQEGEGQKNAGPGVLAAEVRALDQLRQMPGNPKPQYDSEERLNGHKGVIVFQAFVTQDGQLTEFKMMKSTGHRNLDAKTLKALKQWKFYPGQEGWVELPFDWNLKGGPQEMPAFLRRKASK